VNEDANKLNDWTFKIDEISANVYRVRGIDKSGRNVERTGMDPEILLSECKVDALKIDSGLKGDDGQAR
jgi:hypothetical protein